MNTAELLVDAFGRIRDSVRRVLDGIGADALAYQPDERSNPIAWLVWHLTRVQDDHVAHVAGTEQIWTAGGWSRRFGLSLDDSAIGYGHSPAEVRLVRVEDAELLAGYHNAVHDATVRFVGSLRDPDLDRIVDEAWDPPVSLGVRLVSVVTDDLQHVGQAAYVRGLFERC